MTKVKKQPKSYSGNIHYAWASPAGAHSAFFSWVYDSAVGPPNLPAPE